MINLDIVIVTYNRLEKLKKTLAHYHNQTARFRSLIVVDNYSTDGTSSFLHEWKEQMADYDKYVLSLNENKGGSGGFYEGQKFAMSLNPDWIYVADDDAYPDDNMVSLFYKTIEDDIFKDVPAICAKVVNVDGSIAYEHRRKIVYPSLFTYRMIDSQYEDYQRSYFTIDLLSYVGSFLNSKVLTQVGLVNPDYFIYADDGEHSLRLRKFGNILCIPKIKILHDSGQNLDKNNTSIIASWRDYYAIRNLLHMIIKHKPLSAVYSTLSYLRAILTRKYANSEQRKLIRNAIIDAWFNNLGKHKKYLPGWSLQKTS